MRIATAHKPMPGRPASEARQRLSAALACSPGTYEALAGATGLPCGVVRQVLKDLRRSGVASVVDTAPSPARRAPRAVYGAAAQHVAPGHVLAQMLCQAWR